MIDARRRAAENRTLAILRTALSRGITTTNAFTIATIIRPTSDRRSVPAWLCDFAFARPIGGRRLRSGQSALANAHT
jgi:hypothetical protein